MQALRGIYPDLARAPDLIAERGITLGKPLELFAETSSTNDVAKNAARGGAPHGATFVAETQTAGRGRQGRAWLAARGECLLMSVVMRVTCPASRLPTLSLACGLAVRDAIARHTEGSATPKIKWPNDVLIDGKKVSGVLVEGLLQGDRANALVVGVGINVSVRDFPEDIASTATSIALHAKHDVDRAALLADVLGRLDRDVGFVAARGLGLVHARLTEHDALRGQRVRSDDGEGVAQGIDLEGRLVVLTADGKLTRWNAGEVHLLR